MAWLPAFSNKARGSGGGDAGRTSGAAGAMARAAGGQGFYSIPGTPYQAAWDFDRAIKEGVERSLWVFRCVDVIAQAQAGLTIENRKGSEDGPVIEDAILNRVLNRRANPAEPAEAFRYRLSALLLLSKLGVFIERVNGADGRARQLTILPPGATRPIPDPTTPSGVRSFRVNLPTGEVKELSPDKVLWIRHRNHPVNFYEQLTPLEAAGLTVDVDFYARLFNRNFLLNDGRPGGLIGVKGQMSREDMAEVQRRFQGGPGSAGRTTVIEADDISWVDTATNPRDAQYKDMMAVTKSDILLAFGVPESVMGNASGRTYDNAEAEENVFWRSTMIPHMRAIAGAMDTLTVGGQDDDNFLVFNTDEVAALQIDNRRRRKEALERWQAGVTTLEQFYEECGDELPTTLKVPATRVFMLPAGKIPAGADKDVEKAVALMPMGTPPMTPGVDPNTGLPAADPNAGTGNLGGGGQQLPAGSQADVPEPKDPYANLQIPDYVPGEYTDAYKALSDVEWAEIFVFGRKTLAEIADAKTVEAELP